MKKVKKIVVPVDFLETTDSLVEYASYMAESLSADIYFLHVVHFYAGSAMLGFPYAQECEDRLLTVTKERMSNLVTDTKKESSFHCSGEVIVGDPVEKIIEYAEAKDSELIIISTHGAKGLESILLGSVARRVVKRAHCPVLLMNPFKQ